MKLTTFAAVACVSFATTFAAGAAVVTASITFDDLRFTNSDQQVGPGTAFQTLGLTSAPTEMTFFWQYDTLAAPLGPVERSVHYQADQIDLPYLSFWVEVGNLRIDGNTIPSADDIIHIKDVYGTPSGYATDYMWVNSEDRDLGQGITLDQMYIEAWNQNDLSAITGLDYPTESALSRLFAGSSDGEIQLTDASGYYSIYGEPANGAATFTYTSSEITPVPLPASGWVFGLTLVGLWQRARRNLKAGIHRV